MCAQGWRQTGWRGSSGGSWVSEPQTSAQGAPTSHPRLPPTCAGSLHARPWDVVLNKAAQRTLAEGRLQSGGATDSGRGAVQGGGREARGGRGPGQTHCGDPGRLGAPEEWQDLEPQVWGQLCAGVCLTPCPRVSSLVAPRSPCVLASTCLSLRPVPAVPQPALGEEERPGVFTGQSPSLSPLSTEPLCLSPRRPLGVTCPL